VVVNGLQGQKQLAQDEKFFNSEFRDRKNQHIGHPDKETQTFLEF
jgi:hypothetical protein